MNSSDIHPSESVPTVMVNVYSEQAASVTALIGCFSSFVAPGINICEAYFRSSLPWGAWVEKQECIPCLNVLVQ